MNKLFTSLLFCFSIGILFTSCKSEEQSSTNNNKLAFVDSLPTPSEKNIIQRGSYAMAYEFVRSMAVAKFNIDEEYFIKGMKDAMDLKKQPLMPLQEMQIASALYRDSMNRVETKKIDSILAITRKLEDELPALQKDFFEKIKRKPGIIETPRGILVEVIKEGTGRKLNVNAIIDVHLKASFVNGRVFENSDERNRQMAAKVPTLGVVPGWQEAMSYAKENGTYRFYMPSDLAFGKECVYPAIPPNAIVIFDLEIEKISGSFDPKTMALPQQMKQQAPPPGAPLVPGKSPMPQRR